MSRPCGICLAESTWQHLVDVPEVVTGEAFRVSTCSECGVSRTEPVPEHLAPYYASELERVMKASRSRLHDGLKRVLLRIETRRILAEGCPPSVMDIGCGTGDLARLLHQAGVAVSTADADPARPLATIDVPQIPHYRFDFDRAELEGDPALGSSTIILRHVLEHVKQPRQLLQRLIERGAARFYVVVPNAASLERRVCGASWYFWDPPRHLWHFSRRSLERLCSGLSLSITRTGYDTIPNLVPSLYRKLRVSGAPPSVYEPFMPKGLISALSAPLNWCLPGNVIWAVITVRKSS